MKTITNEFFVRFCEVLKKSMLNPLDIEVCRSDMVSASLDDANSRGVYTYDDINIEVIKLDEYTKLFDKKRRQECSHLKTDHRPSAVDAVCISEENKWYFIEFKNASLGNAIKDMRRKMLSSLWLVGYLYSKANESVSSECEFIKFARNSVTFILVVSSDKNIDLNETLGTSWDETGTFYTPSDLEKYKDYYFRDIYVLNEFGLREFVAKFEK